MNLCTGGDGEKGLRGDPRHDRDNRGRGGGSPWTGRLFFIYDIWSMPSPTTNIFPLLTLLFIKGLSCPSFIQASLSPNCLKLTIPGFPYHCLPVSCGDTSFFLILGLVLDWKSGLKAPLMPIGRSCPLQTILLNDLVGCDSPLQIVMVVWRTIIFSRGLSHPTQKLQIQIKRAINICRGFVTPD
jgi:hypothetical protein